MTTIDLTALDAIAGTAQEVLGLRTYAPIGDFIEDPANPRTDFEPDALATLAADIKLHGVIQPVNAVRLTVEEGGKLQIKSGARRYRAAKLAGLDRLPYVLAEVVHLTGFAQVAENEQRENLSPLELAAFAQAQIDAGIDRSEIIAKLHLKDASDLTRLLAFLDPPQWMRQAFIEGRISDRRAFSDLRKHFDSLRSDAEKTDLIQMCASPKQLTREFVQTVRAQPDGNAFTDAPPSALTGTATPNSKSPSASEAPRPEVDKKKASAKEGSASAEKKPKLYNFSIGGVVYTLSVLGANANVKRSNPVKSWVLDSKKTTVLS